MQRCIVAHSPLASALKSVLEDITGLTIFHAVDLMVDQSPEALGEILCRMHEAASDKAWVFFVDFLGGSPMQSLVPLCLQPNVRVLSGVNLPMLLESLKWQDFDDLQQWLETTSHWGIQEVTGRFKEA